MKLPPAQSGVLDGRSTLRQPSSRCASSQSTVSASRLSGREPGYRREYRPLHDLREIAEIEFNLPLARVHHNFLANKELELGLQVLRAGGIEFMNVRMTESGMCGGMPPDDRVTIARVNQGDIRVMTDGGALEYSAGDAYRLPTPGFTYYAPAYQDVSHITIPRMLLRRMGVPEHILRPAGETVIPPGVVDVMFDLIHSFARHAPSSARAVASVEESILGMAAAALEESVSASPSLTAQAKAYIAGNLRDSLLSAPRIAAALHVSERTLYRSFAEEGQPVASYIRSERLRRVKRDLDDLGEAGSIGDVAARWGFTNSGYFAKIFHKEFGLMPSEYVGSGEATLAAAGRAQ